MYKTTLNSTVSRGEQNKSSRLSPVLCVDVCKLNAFHLSFVAMGLKELHTIPQTGISRGGGAGCVMSQNRQPILTMIRYILIFEKVIFLESKGIFVKLLKGFTLTPISTANRSLKLF